MSFRQRSKFRIHNAKRHSHSGLGKNEPCQADLLDKLSRAEVRTPYSQSCIKQHSYVSRTVYANPDRWRACARLISNICCTTRTQNDKQDMMNRRIHFPNWYRRVHKPLIGPYRNVNSQLHNHIPFKSILILCCSCLLLLGLQVVPSPQILRLEFSWNSPISFLRCTFPHTEHFQILLPS